MNKFDQYNGTSKVCTVQMMHLCTESSCEGHRLRASFPERSKRNIYLDSVNQD